VGLLGDSENTCLKGLSVDLSTVARRASALAQRDLIEAC
jgi:hypothetical protein